MVETLTSSERQTGSVARDGEVIMFSPQNKRFTLLVGAITFIIVVTLASVTYLATHGGSATITTIIGFSGPVVVTQLFGFLKQQQDADLSAIQRAQIMRSQEEIKNKTDEAVSKTHEAVQMLGDAAVKVEETKQQVEKVTDGHMKEVVRNALAELGCDGLAVLVAEKVVEALRDQEGKERKVDRPPLTPGV